MGTIAAIARRATTRAPMEELRTVEISTDAGVARDFRGRARKRQVTLLSADVWREVCAELGTELPWTTRRANLLVAGVVLPQAAGDIVEIGDVRLRVEAETAPCSRMDEQFEGLKQALSAEWRGGVACTVLRGGTVSVGDDVRLRADDGG